MRRQKILLVLLLLVAPIFFSLPQQKAGIDLEGELNSEHKSNFTDREIVVEGTDEFVFFSGKKDITPQVVDSPAREKWLEENDVILNGREKKLKHEKNGHIDFAYGNRNFFLFNVFYAGKVKKTVLGVDFGHKSFSHVDVAQVKENSEQLDSDLRFFSESNISSRYAVLFSFAANNRYNRLQNLTSYNRLNKRLFSAALTQKFYTTSLSQISLDLRGNYAQGVLQKKSGENLHSQMGRVELQLDWQKKIDRHEIILSALTGYFHGQEFFAMQNSPFYTFFSLTHSARIWSHAVGKSLLPWNGNLTWQAGAGSYKNDYTVEGSLTLHGRLAEWLSVFKIQFEKKYRQNESDWLTYRYRLADKTQQHEKKIETFWQNEIPLWKKVFVQHKIDFLYHWQTHDFFWDTAKEVWQYNHNSLYLLENRVGLQFQISPIVNWNFYVSHTHMQKKLNQIPPLQFETAFIVHAKKIDFTLRYRLWEKRPDSFSREELGTINMLDTSLMWKIDHRFALMLVGENLLLQKYSWLPPFTEPELTLHLGISIKL